MNDQKSYLDALRSAQYKQMVSKSAHTVEIIDGAGNSVGVGVAEFVPLNSPLHPLNRTDLSKSVGTDPNACFDDSPLFPFDESPDVRPVEISKGADFADTTDALLCSTFPDILQPTR